MILAPRRARYTLHINFRPAGSEWQNRHTPLRYVSTPAWSEFVERARHRGNSASSAGHHPAPLLDDADAHWDPAAPSRSRRHSMAHCAGEGRGRTRWMTGMDYAPDDCPKRNNSCPTRCSGVGASTCSGSLRSAGTAAGRARLLFGSGGRRDMARTRWSRSRRAPRAKTGRLIACLTNGADTIALAPDWRRH